MRIGIDARMIEHSGIGTYIRNILLRLPELSDNEYVLFGDPNKLEKYNMPVIKSDFPIYSLAEQIFFPNVIKKAGLDLFHSMHYTMPVVYSGKIVVTIYDLIHLIFPEYLPSKLGCLYAKFMINSACKKSKKIITISENTKDDVMKYFSIDSSKIRVIYLGVSEVFKPSEEKANIMRKEYGRYMLYVGLIKPHKNILRLIEVFRNLKRNKKVKHKLILIGKGKSPYINEVKEKILDYNMEKEILMFENIPIEKLVDFYCGSDLFVLPSLYEGFGLTLLEAMACGCPVVTSNTSSLPEVVGDAGLMFNPYDINSMEETIYNILNDKTLSQNLIKKGFEQINKFSWKETAKSLLRVYEEVFV